MKKGTKLKHYKGGKYTVLDKAIHTETEEEVVLYVNDEDKRKWIRPIYMFNEEVLHEGEEKIRFEEINPKEYELKKEEKEKNCECCGKMKTNRYYLNGIEVQISNYNVDSKNEENFFKKIIEEYNNGTRHFDILMVETEDDEEYIKINGELYKWGIYYATVAELMDTMNVSYKLEELILSDYKK